MAKQRTAILKEAGWLFWIITTGILLAPCIYAVWRLTTERAEVTVRVSMGVIFAAIASGIITWSVNTVIQTRAERRRVAERKLHKKKKK